MNRITMVFGADAVPDGSALPRAADVLVQHQQAGNVLIVVVSALPGVADMLRESIGLGNYTRVHNKLLSTHSSLARTLIQEPKGRALLIQDLTDMLGTYHWMGRTMINRSPTPSEAAAILAVGERLCARLLAGHLQSRGAQVIHAGEMVVTNADYQAAAVDRPATHRRCVEKLLPLLDEGYIVIVGGGSGITPEGKLTRLAEPHLTGSLLAACSGSAGLWLMTSHDGILTADPAIVPAAQSVPVITPAALTHLALHGLQVPSGAALAPAVDAQIPVYIRNLLNPTHPGTYIQPNDEGFIDSPPIIIARKQIRTLTVTDRVLDPAQGLEALAAESIPALIERGAPDKLEFFLRADHANIGRLVLGQAFPAAHIEADPQRRGLIVLIGTDPDSAAYLARRLDSPARAVLLDGLMPHSAILIAEDSIEAAVEKIHNLTLPQSK